MDDKSLQQFAEQLSDRYRIERELGRGGWGVVYLAEDLRHHREVAVKVLQVEAAGTAARDRFLREIEVEARLAHPHIVPLFDSGELCDVVYYVMPFIAGESLQQRIAREGALPLGDALRSRPTGVRSAGPRARAAGRAPGHQAGEHPAVRSERAGRGFRHRARPRSRRDGRVEHVGRLPARDPGLHGAGAGGTAIPLWMLARTSIRSVASCTRCLPGSLRSMRRLPPE